MKVDVWKPPFRTRFGVHVDRSVVGTYVLVSVRWRMLRVMW